MRIIMFAIIAFASIAVFVLLGSPRESRTAATDFVTPVAAATPSRKPAVRSTADTGVFDLIEFDGTKIDKSDAEWKKLLTPAQFYILRQKGTEREYTGKLTKNRQHGVYHCAACGLALFRSKAKFESGTGWPSFYEPIYKKNVDEAADNSIAAEPRTEVLCARCGGHLGHVFDDGPEPTGLRYCINSAALKFKRQ